MGLLKILGDLPLIMTAVPLLLAWPSLDLRARRHGLCLLGYRERWREDSTADRTWCILYVPLWRSRWTHSTWLE